MLARIFAMPLETRAVHHVNVYAHLIDHEFECYKLTKNQSEGNKCFCTLVQLELDEVKAMTITKGCPKTTMTRMQVLLCKLVVKSCKISNLEFLKNSTHTQMT